MKKCKYCQSDIDKKAKICPNCKKKQRRVPVWLIIVLVILVIAVISSSSGNNPDDNKKTSEKKEKFSIVEGTETGHADDYGIAYYIEGTIKNNTDKKYSYVQVSYNVYDDNGNNLGTCLANNNNLSGNETWKFKAVCSGDAKSITSYKLDEITGW